MQISQRSWISATRDLGLKTIASVGSAIMLAYSLHGRAENPSRCCEESDMGSYGGELSYCGRKVSVRSRVALS